ncbi:MAG: tRNA pseudouridine(38-40) synthase TruA [Tenericutes bacterium]|jgi:tRNA pseudouridine38-40 synthase|nr:tRNA pseudouridine(38-40) synthase TruA [Mycoplasmatota bacterium]
MRFLISITYDGTNFKGFQKQVKLRTIQGEIEKVLKRINNNQEVDLIASGRTDALVHAKEQKAHFDLTIKIKTYKLKQALNSYLPKDIYVNKVCEVSNNFHARYNVKEKTYEYVINMGEYNPLERNYIYQYNKLLNIKKIKKALKYLIGEHDFKAFVSADEKRNNYVRIINKVKIKKCKNKLMITFTGNGFLKHMIRNIIGVIILISEGKKETSYMNEILNNQNKNHFNITAPAGGLYLKKVRYKEEK